MSSAFPDKRRAAELVEKERATTANSGSALQVWHYDPAADFDPALVEEVRCALYRPGILISGVRWLTAAVLRCWLRIYHGFTIVGWQHLPADRSFILIANHASHLDTLCLLSALPFRRLRRAFPAAARDYFCVSGPRALLAAIFVNALPFDRQLVPWRSLSTCAHLLENEGTILILFPEGTRRHGSEPGEFKAGVALLAAGRDIPVVPCHLAGTGAALPKGAWCPRPRRVRLTIGAPRVYAHLPPTKESVRRICRELREVVMLLGAPSGNSDEAGSSFEREVA